MKQNQVFLTSLALLLGLFMTSCNSSFKIDKYFKDYEYDASLANLRADQDRFKPVNSGFQIVGKSSFLGFPVDEAYILHHQNGDGFKSMWIRLMPSVSKEKAIQKLSKVYGDDFSDKSSVTRWDKGKYYIDLSQKGNEGPSIYIVYHKSAFEPYQGFDWGTERSVIESKIGLANEALYSGDSIYQVPGVFADCNATVKYSFVDDKLDFVLFEFEKVPGSNFFGRTMDVPNSVIATVTNSLVEQYGAPDEIYNSSTVDKNIWNFPGTYVALALYSLNSKNLMLIFRNDPR